MQLTEHMRNLGAVYHEAQRIFPFFMTFQTSCGVHPAPGGTGARGSLLGDKVARTWNWPLSSVYCHFV